MKTKMLKCIALVLSMVCLFCFPVQASAAAQGTEGTEQEIMQAQQLEIYLGQAWAGVEFQLRTDAGKYPEPIPVGENGILSLEIGGSEHYFLTCQASRVEAPLPEETVASTDETLEMTENTEENATEASTEETVSDEATTATDSTEVTVDEEPENGIPTSHIVIFACGLLIAIAALVLLHMHQKRNNAQDCDADDDL